MKAPQVLLLYSSLVVLWSRGCGQPYLRLRPSPSDNLPIKDIIEHPDSEYDPKEQDLDERTLKKKLGRSFDPHFMSVAAPAQGNLSYPHYRLFKGTGPLPNELKKLDLEETPYGARLQMNKKVQQKFLQWLWAYMYCPVIYTWKDLGPRFWPRYIKEGNCFSEQSCSFPEGMYCKPVTSVTKTFLRWYCQGWSRQKYCTWIPVQYRVISKCKCTC